MLGPDKIKGRLVAAVKALEADPTKFAERPGKDFTRNRKLKLGHVVNFLLTMEDGSMPNEIQTYFGNDDFSPVSLTAVFHAREKLSDQALPNVFETFTDSLPARLYRNKYQLIACDGSAVSIPLNPLDSDTYFKPKKDMETGYNQVHLNACYSILDRKYTDALIQPARKSNEYQAFCKMVDNEGSKSNTIPRIYLCDRNYASYNNYAHIIQSGHYFVIRCTDKRLKGILGEPVKNLKEIDCKRKLILSRTQSAKKRRHPERAKQYRYIARATSFDYFDDQDISSEYNIELRVVRFQLSSGVWENLVTNLPRGEFKLEDFIELYHLRWDIESSFRDIKYPLCLTTMHSAKYKFILQEIWARLILFNFCNAIVDEIEIEEKNTKHKYVPRLSSAYCHCRSFLRGNTKLSGDTVVAWIKAYTLPKRPNRTYPRNKRRFNNLNRGFQYRS